MRIYDNILDTLGDTPMVRLRRFLPDGPLLAAKIEYFNPGSSVKDRVGDEAVLVTLFPDSGERYLSKLNQEWLREQGLLEEEES